ncbi:MAG: bifunctional pyr operon transcriptional regulator/uracil phosphoribosyltransferase PyrR [Flammeovirgaceae bacterium]|jgi:pyrimidine operon attenuation protein / uracil phosphoribosyltransferase|nr:bifunctional pyr operon transcriptional regulator/uracil phosphoribosyltransferase PyrR [Flammeovirgaceae bacterium]|tara:strand:- start:61475 stop:62020 length:546 start_codon:yes stop_codon:yes gene_type:complete
MQKRLLLDSQLLQITIQRLCQQLIENHDNFSSSVILGLQPRGIFLASRIQKVIAELEGHQVQVGYLDTTFHRDDFRRRDLPKKASETRVPFLIENKEVILVDDVLFTGRSVRAALDAMISFGRPNKVELLVLIDRLYSRQLPISANYVGREVNTLASQHINVSLKEQDGDDSIWLMNTEEA